ncbi:uncharacterized protein LOC129911164 [Episyrphus balteatus]|uniref:uncharacterized protein LOC129911164 n=1 Tax=Episyrphus balteatus TaxID=286459 RepID=UPI002486C029|nr:uncharacterized protein LOC129911164 [Episyrphus balteatus]
MAYESVFDEDVEKLSKLIETGTFRFKIVSARCSPGSSSGDNYMSVVKRIVLIGRDSDENEKNTSLIVKRQIASLSRRELYRCDEAFGNEISAFNEVVPLLERQTTSGLIFPRCYFAGSDEAGDIIVLEDLKEQNFSMRNRLHGLDFEHCKLVMEELARLHAASIGAKRADFYEFRSKMECLRDIVYCEEAREFYKNVLDSAIDEAVNSLRTSNTDGCLTEAIRLIEILRPTLFEKLKANISSQMAPNTVICHGDLWINNMMFKDENATGKPIAVRFFDLQAMRYTSPVFDILHFLYTSTKRDMRDVYLAKILETYCNRVNMLIDQQNYQDIGIDLDAIKKSFSLQSIIEEFKEKVLYGLAICMWILPAVTFDVNNLPNLDLLSETNQDGKELKCTQKLTPEYHSRIRDLALEFYENGFLNCSE